MARKARESDLQPGKHVHYWGENWQVWSNNGNSVLLVVPGRSPGGWYRPHASDMTKPTSVTVSIDNDYLLCFDEIKRDPFGREIE